MKMLAQALEQRGFDVVTCHDPGGTPLGDALRALLLDRGSRIGVRPEALLFLAARAQLIEEIIQPALAAGSVVLTDRYMTATLVYQGYAGGLAVDELRQLGRFACWPGIVPGHTFVLDLPVEVAEGRRGRTADRMEARSRGYQESVRAGFLAEAAAEPQAFTIVDASRGIDAIHGEILEKTVALLGDRS
jgi:dTMP kinase